MANDIIDNIDDTNVQNVNNAIVENVNEVDTNEKLLHNETFTENEVVAKVFIKLKRKLQQIGYNLTDEEIYDEIEDAIEAVNYHRNYIPTETSLVEAKYTGLIGRLCLSSFAKMGAEGEKGHSENGIVRSYDSASNYPQALLKEIIPLAKAR